MHNVLAGLAVVLDGLLTFYFWIVVVGALISWVNPDPYNPIVRFLRGVTEPVFRPIRRLLGRWMMVSGIDLSPLVVILLIQFLQYAAVANLREWAAKLN
ncbi:MAG: YggT family protein [Nitrospirae bacterium]|nr:YggT family protein [Nitrospirota bacterium]